ncbi:hypothetical protein P4J00_14640 [Bacillus cereus]|nr:hypothetical protein [Bacillus cereus]
MKLLKKLVKELSQAHLIDEVPEVNEARRTVNDLRRVRNEAHRVVDEAHRSW